jgi:DNA-binding MarR family transcriptional regulator
MWSNFMQYVPAEGAPLGQLADLARITNLAGLDRWRYIVVEPDPADSRPKPPRRDWIVRPTRAGRRAQQVWQPLTGVIEERWQQRFGKDAFGGLIESLQALAGRADAGLPRYLPVAGVTKQGVKPLSPERAGAGGRAAPPLDLPALLSRLLISFTIDFERESDLSLAVSANALRVITEDGMRVRDLPLLAGVSKEAISVSLGLLQRRRLVGVEPDPAASRGKVARLTPEGRLSQDAYHRLAGVIDERWQARFGAADVTRLSESLQALFAQSGQDGPRMSQGLRPYPDGWRAHGPYLALTTAMVSDPAGALPHYPMVSHRGGFPDGS